MADDGNDGSTTAHEFFKGYPPEVKILAGNPEAQKYGEMWAHPEYRVVSPGEDIVPQFLATARPRPGSTVIDFGCGTGRASRAMAQAGLKVTMVDFVRNSLDDDVRALVDAVPPQLLFVKADLEQPIPLTAEFGYCTDVMEHIPDANVERVLKNILLAAQHVFFSISTIDDNCGALIGQQLHMTVKPYSWWLDLFIRIGCIVHWSQTYSDEACSIYVTAWQDGQAVVNAGVVNTTDDQIRANVETNCAAGWEQIYPHETNDVEVMILGGGPSLAAFEEDIKQKRREGVKLITLNGTYNWCLERGLIPSATIIVDARAFNARFVQPVVDKCKYLIASQCDPSVLEGLPKDRTLLWHTSNDAVRDIIIKHFDPAWPIPGGSTVLLRAIPLLRTLGFKKFHLYGCDSSLADNGAHHAYDQAENDGVLVVPVTVTGGRIFSCHPWMAAQAQEFMSLIRVLGDEIELEIYGDGLLAHILTAGAELADRVDSMTTWETAPDESIGHRTATLDEIIPGLWVGNIEGALPAKERGLRVLGVRHLSCPADDDWVPILVGNHRENLDRAADIIERDLAGPGIFVHCLVGMERAPLTVAWFLHIKRGMTLDDAYALIKAKHPITEDRRRWIDGANLQGVRA